MSDKYDDKLTPHFKLCEFYESSTADKCGIDNTIPSIEVYNNLKRVALGLETIRLVFGNKPIKISSGFRCYNLNCEVGGKKQSAHLEGRAADFNILYTQMKVPYVFQALREYLEDYSQFEVDQLIYERNKKTCVEWIHYAVPKLGDVGRREFFALRV